MNSAVMSKTENRPMSKIKTPIAIAKGDGIGPEIMDATLAILEASGANLDIHEVEIGEKVYLRGSPTGIEPKTWETIRNTRAFLKAPITTPQGGGFKSLNVTVRATLGLYANVRPCVSYYPFVDTKHPQMDVVIVRENEEDLYTGIEYRQTPDTTQALKIITRQASEKIIRYAFNYALANKRKKVTCFTKDNILKLTDGLFHKVFEQVAAEYPEIQHEHWIVDIGAAKLADTPEAFDVVVLENLYGDILSDIAAQIAGSVGLAGSANIGKYGAMFEAIHGSAPRRAGQNLANPSGLILAAVQMLVHVELYDAAEKIHNAWLTTLEDGIHTYDIYKEGVSKAKVGTKEFAQAVIERLGKKPHTLKAVRYGAAPKHHAKTFSQNEKSPIVETVGVDVFIYWPKELEALQKLLLSLNTDPLKLTMISNRGVAVWPQKSPESSSGDTWRCRYQGAKGKTTSHENIAALLTSFATAKIPFTQIQNLCSFNGQPGYQVAQEEQ